MRYPIRGLAMQNAASVIGVALAPAKAPSEAPDAQLTRASSREFAGLVTTLSPATRQPKDTGAELKSEPSRRAVSDLREKAATDLSTELAFPAPAPDAETTDTPVATTLDAPHEILPDDPATTKSEGIGETKQRFEVSLQAENSQALVLAPPSDLRPRPNSGAAVTGVSADAGRQPPLSSSTAVIDRVKIQASSDEAVPPDLNARHSAPLHRGSPTIGPAERGPVITAADGAAAATEKAAAPLRHDFYSAETSPLPGSGVAHTPESAPASGPEGALQGAIDARSGAVRALSLTPTPDVPASPRIQESASPAFAIASIAHRDDGGFELQLDPPDLGVVTIEFYEDDAGAQRAAVSADQRETLDLLRRHAEFLQRDLARMGVGDVILSFTDRRDQNRSFDAQNGRRAFRFGETPEAMVAGSSSSTLAALAGRVDLIA